MTPFEELKDLLEWAFLERQKMMEGDNTAFKKAWAKTKKLLCEEYGWTVEQFDTEIDRRMRQRGQHTKTTP